jgi:hypothetical protein
MSGSKKRDRRCIAFDAYTLPNAPHLPRVLVPPQRNEPRVPQVPVRRPLDELELPNQLRP